MNRTPLLIAVATAVLALSATREARAVGPIDVEVGAIAGGGSSPSNLPSGFPNPLGFGIGGRGGVGIFGFYGGIEGMYYVGSSGNVVSSHSAMYGVDVGYNIKIVNLTLRPLLGIGNYTMTTSASDIAGGSTNNSTLYLQPGATLLVGLGLLYVGADANVLILTSLPQGLGNNNGTDIAFTFHGQVGVHF